LGEEYTNILYKFTSHCELARQKQRNCFLFTKLLVFGQIFKKGESCIVGSRDEGKTKQKRFSEPLK